MIVGVGHTAPVAPFALNINHPPAPAFLNRVRGRLEDHGGEFDPRDIGHDIGLVPRQAEC